MSPQHEQQTGSMHQSAQEKTQRMAEEARMKSSEVVNQARETAKSGVEQQKGRAAESVGSVAHALRQTGTQLNDQNQAAIGRVAEQAADRLDRISRDLQTKSVDEMINDVQNFARRDPQLFLGGAVVVGLLAARFLRSSSTRQQQPRYDTQVRSYPSSSMRSYTQQDLADYRRDVLRDEYSGTPSTYGTTGTGLGTTGTTGTLGETGTMDTPGTRPSSQPSVYPPGRDPENRPPSDPNRRKDE